MVPRIASVGHGLAIIDMGREDSRGGKLPISRSNRRRPAGGAYGNVARRKRGGVLRKPSQVARETRRDLLDVLVELDGSSAVGLGKSQPGLVLGLVGRG